MQRRQSRKLIRIRAEFTSSSEQEDFTGHGYTSELSVSGCQIESTTVLPIGRYLTLRLYRAENPSEPIQVELARVRWVEGRTFGVEFIRRNSESHSRLTKWVSSTTEESDHPSNHAASLTILVVEDNPDEMLLYSKVLEKAGHKVLQATGSIEAMKVGVDQPQIDLAIVDVVLTVPDLTLHAGTTRFRRVNGPQLIKDLVALRKELRALFMSSLDSLQLKNHGVMLDKVPFLKKPFSKKELLSAIENTLAFPPLVWTPPPPVHPDQITWKD